MFFGEKAQILHTKGRSRYIYIYTLGVVATILKMVVPLDDDKCLIKKMGGLVNEPKKMVVGLPDVCFHLCVYMYLYEYTYNIYIYSPVNIAMENPNLSWYHEKW